MAHWKGIVGKGFDPDDPVSGHGTSFANYVAGLRWAAWRPRFCVLHHTGAPTLAQWLSGAPAATRMQNLQHYYRDELGWSAGPHLFVAPDLIWVFTPLTVPGVHSPSWNLLSWGIEMVGDYDTEDFFAGDGLRVHRNAIAALATLHEALGLAPAARHLHRYLAEFDFRYNQRVALGIDDPARTEAALQGIVGKRLTYRDS